MQFLIKYFLIIWLIDSLNAGLNQDNSMSEWSKWKKKHNKEYSIGRQETVDNAQELVRFNIFKERLDKINEHNSKVSLFKMGTNEFSDQTITELDERFNQNIDIKTVKDNVKKLKPQLSNSKRNLETSVNWIENGVSFNNSL